jgi:hypothetical protein
LIDPLICCAVSDATHDGKDPRRTLICLDTPRIWRCTAQRLSITKSRK